MCQVDYTCMVNSIKWFHTTPDNITTTHIKVGITVMLTYLNPLRADVLDSLVWLGGGAQHYPWKISEGVV